METPHGYVSNGNNLVGLGAVLALGLVTSTFVGVRALERSRASEIAVKGYAERKIISDHGVWRGHFTVRGETLVGTYDALRKHQAVVNAWLKKQGVNDAELSSVTTSIEHRRAPNGTETNEIEGYVLAQGVTVEGGDIALISKVATQSTELIESGVAFESDQPLWFYTKLDDLKIEMLGAAAKDARVRAERIAKESKGSVGGLRSADQGVFQITAPTSTEVSGFGELDTSSVQKSVKAIVTVRYAVD